MDIEDNPFLHLTNSKFSPYSLFFNSSFWEKCLLVFSFLSNDALIRILGLEPLCKSRGGPLIAGVFSYITLSVFIANLAERVFGYCTSSRTGLVGAILGAPVGFILTLLTIPAIIVETLLAASLVLIFSPLIGFIHVISADKFSFSENEKAILNLKLNASIFSDPTGEFALEKSVSFKDYLSKQKLTITQFFKQARPLRYNPDATIMGCWICENQDALDLNINLFLKQPREFNALLKLNLFGFTQFFEEACLNKNSNSLQQAITLFYEQHKFVSYKGYYCALEAGHEFFGTILKLKSNVLSDELIIRLFILYSFGNEHIAFNEKEAKFWEEKFARLIITDEHVNTICDALAKATVSPDATTTARFSQWFNIVKSNNSNDSIQFHYVELKKAIMENNADDALRLLKGSLAEVAKYLTERDYFELGNLLVNNGNDADKEKLFWGCKILHCGYLLNEQKKEFFDLLGQKLVIYDINFSERTAVNQLSADPDNLSDDDIKRLIEFYVPIIQKKPAKEDGSDDSDNNLHSDSVFSAAEKKNQSSNSSKVTGANHRPGLD